MKQQAVCRICYIDCRTLDKNKLPEYLAMVDEERRKKVLSYSQDDDRMLSVGAGILIADLLMKLKSGTRIVYSENGKPFLCPDSEGFISITHSGNYAAISYSSIPCTIDAEAVHVCDISLAKRFFTERECKYIGSFRSDKGRKKAFTRVWTRKESFIKLTGEGLSRPLGSFETNPRGKTSIIDGRRIYYSEAALGDCIVSVACKKPLSIFLEEFKIS